MALPRAKLGVSLFRHPCRKPLPPGERQCMLGWLCICAIVVVCCRCVLHRLCPTTCMRPCKALGHTRPATVPGLSVGLPPLDQARMLAVSHTKPLHDAVAQMADDLYGGLRPKARMLWLLAKSFARCKTNRASNKRHPFLNKQEVFRQTKKSMRFKHRFFIKLFIT